MLTLDRSTLIAERLGATQAETPEGYLSIDGVRIARVGSMIYGPGETPVEPNESGWVRIERDAETLFHPDTIASFNGKPVTVRHPDDMLDPDNVSADGVTLNVRRGTGLDSEFLVADLLIWTRKGIDAVRSGKLREVSAGYDADYEPIKPGFGRQVKITGNHVALVDRARCGPACSIGDADMATAPKASFVSRILSAFHAKDERALLATLDEAPEDIAKPDDKAVHVHIHHAGEGGQAEEPEAAAAAEPEPEPEDDPMDRLHGMVKDCMTAISDHHNRMATHDASIEDLHARLSKLEKGEEAEEEKDPEVHEQPKGEEDPEPEAEETEEAPEPKEDEDDENKRPVKDSAALADTWRNTLSLAEIIAPGFKPAKTFDAKAKFEDGAKTICEFRRAVLKRGAKDAKAKSIIDDAFGEGATFDADYSCKWIDREFRPIADAVAKVRNASAVTDGISPDEARRKNGGVSFKSPTVADLQRRNEALYPRPGRKV